MFEILCNVKITHDGSTHRFQAGIYDDLPKGVGELLVKDGLAVRVQKRQAKPAETKQDGGGEE